MLASRNFSVLALCIIVFSIAFWKLFSQGTAHARARLDDVLNRIVADASAVGSMATGAKADTGNRDLIFYSYAETDEARKNFAFFRRHALHAKADFIFMLNGEHTVDLSETRHLPNVRIVERKNECFDLGGYWEVLTANDTLTQHYKRFIFMNASLRGPFFPAYAEKSCWSDAYWDQLDNSTRLAGMTWNCAKGLPVPPHLQSMIWATDQQTLQDIILPNLKCFENMPSAIMEGETVIASLIMQAGYEVYAFEGRYNAHAASGRVGGGGKNSTAFLEWCEESDDIDILHSGAYEGSTISPYETIFAKTNRDWVEGDRRMIDLLSEHVELSGYSSYDHCV